MNAFLFVSFAALTFLTIGCEDSYGSKLSGQSYKDWSNDCDGNINDCFGRKNRLGSVYGIITDIKYPDEVAHECGAIVLLNDLNPHYTFLDVFSRRPKVHPNERNRAKIFIFCPGYETIIRNFRGKDYRSIKTDLDNFIASIRFTRLPEPFVLFKGRLIGSQGEPIVGKKVSLINYLSELYEKEVSLAYWPRSWSGITNDEGYFEVKIHSFLDDAGLVDKPTYFSFIIEDDHIYRQYKFNPWEIPVQRNYQEIFTIKLEKNN